MNEIWLVYQGYKEICNLDCSSKLARKQTQQSPSLQSMPASMATKTQDSKTSTMTHKNPPLTHKKAHSYPSNNRPKPNNIQHESTSHNNPLQLTKKTHYDQSNNPSQPITMSAQKVTIDHQSTQNRNCESVIAEPERESKKEEIDMWKNWIMFRNLYMIIYKNTTQNKRRDHKNTCRLFSTNSFAL